MAFLGGYGYVYYASNSGDSYILQMQSDIVEDESTVNENID
jgi:hypothetical protein